MMKKIASRSFIIRVISTMVLAVPAVILLNSYLPKYNGDIKIVSKNSNNNFKIDINNDSIPEKIMLKNINGGNQTYAEVWSGNLLLGVWNGTGKVLNESIRWEDIDKDGNLEAIFITIDKDSIYLNQLQFKIVNKKLITQRELKKNLFKSLGIEEYTLNYKTELIDLNGDGSLDYVFNLNHNIPIRGIYAYDFKNRKFIKTDLNFIHVVDFKVLDSDAKKDKQILFTRYANCNISNENINKIIDKYNLDTALAQNYYPDCDSYLGLLDANLSTVIKPLVKKGFTGMFRANLFKEGGETKILVLESYLNQIDSLQVLKILNNKLEILKEKKVHLPFESSDYTKYNSSLFQKVKIGNIEKFLFVGLGDSIYELNSSTLSVDYVMSVPQIKKRCKISEFDLDEDSINEIIFCCENGLYVFRNDLKDGVFIPSEVELDYKNPFIYTYFKEKIKGVSLISHRNHIVIQYAFNKFYSFKMVFIALIFIFIYLLLFLPQYYKTRRLEQENKNLEELVEERTLEVKQQNKDLESKNKEINIQKNIVVEKHKEITDSINYAERIQRSFLASPELLDENLKDYFVFFQPKDVVSGDFYWAHSLKNGNFALVTADSTGHGVPGAIMSLLNTSSLERAVELGICEPAEILNHTRQTIIERLKKDGSAEGGKDGMDCSLISFNSDKSKIIYSAANNPIWIVRASAGSASNQLIELPADKIPVGKHDRDCISFTQHEVDLQKGDMIYTITDGFPDQFGGPKGKKYMYKKLKVMLVSISNLLLNEQHDFLKKSLKEWMGNTEQVDDITIIGIRV